MNANEFKQKLDKSMNIQFIVAGLAGLIEGEGYNFHEAMEVLEDIKRNTFPALMEISQEVKK